MSGNDVSIVILCGIPGAGKSNLAVSVKDFLKGQDIQYGNIHTVIVCYDSLISEELTFEKGVDTLNQSWKDRRQDVVNLVGECIACVRDKKENNHSIYPVVDRPFECSTNTFLCNCLLSDDKGGNIDDNNSSASHIFIIDDNMFYRSMRYAYYQLARQYSVGFCQIYTSCDLSTAWKRNVERERPVSAESFNGIASKFEEPINSNYPWEATSLKVNTDKDIDEVQLKALANFVLESLRSPVKPLITEDEDQKKIAQLITNTNLIHQVDRILRNHVSQRIKDVKENREVNGQRVKGVATSLSKQKKEFLDALRKKEDLKSRLHFILQTHVTQSKDLGKHETTQETVVRLLEKEVVKIFHEYTEQ